MTIAGSKPLQFACFIIALVMFVIAAWAASWPAPSNYWNGRFTAAGMCFLTLAFLCG